MLNLNGLVAWAGEAIKAVGSWAYDSGAVLTKYLGDVINTVVGK